MRRSKSVSKIIVLMILTSIMISTFSFQNTNVIANFEVPYAVNSFGLIYVPDNSSLMMTKADINYDIHYDILDNFTNPQHFLNYDFQGSYIVYNPNETVVATSVIPFAGYYSSNYYDLEVTVNDTLYSYESILLWYPNASDIIDQYLPFSEDDLSFTDSIGELIVFNTTFEEQSYYNITYTYSYSTLRGPLSYASTTYDYFKGLQVYYILSTSQLWNNYIDETVIMSFEGEIKPDGYTTPCIVSQIEGILYYNWSWINEPIDKNKVGIYFYYMETTHAGNKLNWLFTLLIIASLYPTIKRKR